MVPARRWISSKRCPLLTRTRKPGLKTTDEFHLRPILPIASGVAKFASRAGSIRSAERTAPGGETEQHQSRYISSE